VGEAPSSPEGGVVSPSEVVSPSSSYPSGPLFIRVGLSAGGRSSPSPSGPRAAPELTPPRLLAPSGTTASVGETSSSRADARTKGPGSTRRRS
jgi:hypothetical protein